MKPAQKQLALKAGLLMILATNVSWTGSKTASSPQFHVSNFASSELGGSGGTVPGRSDNIPTLNIAPPVLTPADGPKPDAAITGQSVSTIESFEFKMICSVPVKIHYIQVKEGGADVVRAYVTNRETSKDMPGLREEGTYADLIANADSKVQWDLLVHEKAVDSLTAQGKDCSSDLAANAPHGPQSPTAPDSQREIIARGLQNCSLDQNGRALVNSDRFACNLKRLESISLDQASGTDDDVNVDQNGRLIRRRRPTTSSAGIAQVQSALRPLETLIKALLLSSNEDKRSDGADHIDDVVTALETVRDTASNPTDERAITKMIDGLQKGYVLGGKVEQENFDYTAKVAAIDSKISDLQSSMIGMNQYQAMQVNQQLQALGTLRNNVKEQVNTNRDYLTLRTYSQQGVIDSNDFTDFTADYNTLLGQLYGTTVGGNGTNNGLIQAPEGIVQSRGQGVSTDQRAVGLQNPAFPQINFQGLGLQNPSIAGGQNPMMPTSMAGYPQTSGFPTMNGMPTTNPYPSTQFPATAQFPQVSQFPQTMQFPQTAQFPVTQFPQQTFPQATFQQQFPMTNQFPQSSLIYPQAASALTPWTSTQPMRL